ncbi:HD domain-containing protein [Salinibacter altiplanensis]|uniref:HD domain-containing protein n=1 Tax=Salinibacter altiplanensis TaxID=1803181 RepID=UPI000C9F3D9D|nr:HD domain-containing protein [Salinibacter altiplanensis]
MPSSTDAWGLWEDRFADFLDSQTADAAHDRAHVERVAATARRLAQSETAQMDVVMPAAWLHDCVVLPKDAPDRASAARRAADTARDFLTDEGYPEQWIPDIEHAIAAHSYSGDTEPETAEAKVVQDADRLDALGAIGIARCFTVGGALDQSLYNLDDPFCDDRAPEDDAYTLDHFYAKLLRLPETMRTDAGRTEAKRRAAYMRSYLERLDGEIDTD